MRVAPVGLLFRDDQTRLWEESRKSALPTHHHPLGVEGAQLIALAVALASRSHEFNRDEFFAALLQPCQTIEYREKLAIAASIQHPDQLAPLGNRIEALHSAPTAIASFALTPGSYAETIANVIFLGGDTDTLAAMAGGISGAYLGLSRMPPRLVDRLERSPKGRPYLEQLAEQLFARYQLSKSASLKL